MAVTKVVMPKLSEAMESGKIIKWLKKEGDRIAAGDILAEVETDKADVEMEAFGAGVLRKILAQAGSTAPVGSLIGVIAEPDDDIAAVAASAPAAAPAAAKSAPAPTKPAAAPAPAAAKPAAGAPAMASRPAEVPPTPKSEDPAERAKPAPVTAASETARAAASSSTDAAGRDQAAQTSPPQDGATEASEANAGRVKASPLAKKIAAQSGVDLKLIQGSGPGGRIIRRDVEAASATPAARPGAAVEAGVEFEDLPLSPMRATIARRMPQSKGPVPHFYVTSEVAMDRAWELREELNGLEGQPKISVNDLVVRACALALIKHPGVNASFQGEAIRVYHRAHIGIAVALEEGLITPVLRDCHAKSLAQIAVESRDLAERARNRKLRAQEMSGATFSISNLGMFDVADFSAIINPPEGAILAVGSVRRVPVVEESGVGVGRRMNMTISCDHRVMDGAMGAKFLQDVKRLLEEPLRLLL
jgi:pyruvate dehydrogenase E2 component (dihydrolipoyllysine-residue acetyltransferase)